MHMVRQTLQMVKMNIPISIAMTIFIMPESCLGRFYHRHGFIAGVSQIEMEVQVYACSKG